MFPPDMLLKSMVREGRLCVIDAKGARHVYGEGGVGPRATIRFTDTALERKLLLNPHLYFGEGYMDGRIVVEEGELYDVLDLVTRSIGLGFGHWSTTLLSRLRRLGKRLAQYNPAPRARRNVAHHYDLSGALYDLFLDADRQYSCAYFHSPQDSLDQAQENKKRHIAAKLLLEPGQRVLDIGSGWGGLALTLARLARVEVLGITLSAEQLHHARARAERAGLAQQVRFELLDYREVEGRFDRIVSVGMFEHVGVVHYHAFFDKIRSLLSPDGVALLHSIGRADGPGATNPWIRKYIFPGGYTPALSEVLPAIERTRLYLTDVEILRLHYAETLRHWRRRFLANLDKARALYDERFCRMWEFYLAGAEVGFRYGGLMVFQAQLAKTIDAVPLTRDYMVDWERSHGTMPGG